MEHNKNQMRRMLLFHPVLTLCGRLCTFAFPGRSDMDELLTPEQVADQLQVSARTVRLWLRGGDLIGIKVGKSWRVHPTDIRRLLDEQLLSARLERAMRVHPEHSWVRGYCRECGMLVPVPGKLGGNHWVCSSACQDAYDSKADAVVGRGTPEFAQCASTVIPPF